MFTNICWGKQRAVSRLLIYFWFLEAGLLADLADCPLPNDGFASRCPWLLLADLLLTSIFRANDAQRREWYCYCFFCCFIFRHDTYAICLQRFHSLVGWKTDFQQRKQLGSAEEVLSPELNCFSVVWKEGFGTQTSLCTVDRQTAVSRRPSFAPHCSSALEDTRYIWRRDLSCNCLTFCSSWAAEESLA